MLTRVHADNFRCFVDFEFRVGKWGGVLTGRRGSGRSSLLILLERVVSMLALEADHCRIWDNFPVDWLTAWTERFEQVIEVDVELDGVRYTYRVEVAHGDNDDELETRLIREEFRHGDRLLFSFADGYGQLHEQAGSFSKLYNTDGTSPVLSRAMRETKHAGLHRFADWWRNDVWILFPKTDEMLEFVDGKECRPGITLDRFAAWYRHEKQANPRAVSLLEGELSVVLDGFVRLQIVHSESTRSKRLVAVFRHPTDPDRTMSYGLCSLSGREQVLIALYSILHLAMTPGRLVCIEAPDGALDSAELGRWLRRMIDRAKESSAQVLAIVNEPGVIRDLPAESVRIMERTPDGSATVKAR